jgi:hypothetical protein
VIAMPLRCVQQENETGCFVAAIACLLGKTYQEAYALLHPGKNPYFEYSHGWNTNNVAQATFDALTRVGIKAHLSSYRRFRTYQKYPKHALLIIRWTLLPHLCHTIVYDHKGKQFLNPSWGGDCDKDYLKYLEPQLDFGIVIDKLP